MLAGNQLLEELVSGKSAGEHAGEWASGQAFAASSRISDATRAQKARVASLMGGSGESVGRVSSAVSSIMANLNGARDENSLQTAADGIAGLRDGEIKVTDSSMVMNTELATAIHLEGMLNLAEAIVGSEG